MKQSIFNLKCTGLLLCSLSTLCSLTGCLIERDVYVTSPYKPIVKTIQKEIFVPLMQGKLMLSTQNHQKLLSFKDQMNPERRLQGEIIFYGLTPSEQTSQFKTKIERILNENRTKSYSLSSIYETRAKMTSLGLSTGALIRLNQFHAVMPVYPGFDDYTMDGRISPEGEITFGCATASNLAAMVTDPQDLVQAQDLAPSDPHLAAAALENLRTGKTKDLKIEKIQSNNG